MTDRNHEMDSRRQSPEQASNQDALREGDHDHGLQDVTVEVLALSRPVPSVLRITGSMAGARVDPNWALPNTAFRIPLDTEQGDASRIYTVRSVDEAAGSFDFDIVLHPHTSLMMQWAQVRKVGDRFRINGPRPQAGLPQVVGRQLALFLDETAIPALYGLLSQAPRGLTGIGWVATDDPAAFAELPALPGLTLQRVDPLHAGASGMAPLVVQALALQAPSEYVVWGAGERDEMRTIRQYFRNTVGLGKDEVAIAGYWKRGTTNTEIDQHRLKEYQRIVDSGGALADYDDLSIGI